MPEEPPGVQAIQHPFFLTRLPVLWSMIGPESKNHAWVLVPLHGYRAFDNR